MGKLGVKGGKKCIIGLLLGIIFLNMSQTHHVFHMLILAQHLILYLHTSIVTPLVIFIQLYLSLQKLVLLLHDLLHIGILSPGVFDQILFGVGVDVEKIKFRALIQYELGSDLRDPDDREVGTSNHGTAQ